MKNNIEVRSTIVIKVKKEDIGKSIKADKSLEMLNKC